MEGVLQYRLLGSHPAASGRNYTIGFPGDSVPLADILKRLVTEHHINLGAFKLEISRTKAPPKGASSTAAPVEEKIVDPHAVLRAYDRIAITVSKRSLMDDSNADEARRAAAEAARIQEMEQHLASTDLTATSTSATAAAGRPHTTGMAGSSAASDPLALERAARVANKNFPVRPNQKSALSSAGIDDPSNDHKCVLCDLGAYDEMLAPCCRFPVCTSCFESAGAMTMSEGDCPVCGISSSTTTSSSAPLTSSATASFSTGKVPLMTLRSSDVPRGECAKRERSSDRLQHQHQHHQQHNNGGTAAAHQRRVDVRRFEEDLRADLGRILTFLDVRADALTSTMKAKRGTASATLSALD